MDISRLRALRELRRCRTMAAAAEALCLTPSAISQQVAQLEEEAGIALTERQGRGVRLTPAGDALVAHAERILAVIDEAKSELAQLRREIAGELRVAAFPSIASAVLPETVNVLRPVFPRLAIVVDEMEPIDGIGALESWRADVALIDDLTINFGQHESSIGQVELTTDILYALLPENHALAKRASIRVSDLRHESWALDSTSSAFGDFILGLCHRAGFEPKINAKCRGFEVVGAMVSAGCSISVAPGLQASRPLRAMTAVRLRPDVRRKIFVAFRRGERNHPAVTVFLEEVLRTTSKLLSTGGKAKP